MARKVIGMARQAAGPPGSRRRHWAMLLSFAVIVGAGLVFVQTVLAVKDSSTIQLDGDAKQGEHTVQTGTNGVDDWDNVCYEAVQKPVAEGGLALTPAQALAKCGTNVETAGRGGATAVSWVEELSSASSIFTGGGSKDPQDISQWLWKDDQNNPPDKDNIEHSYAARYSVTSPVFDPNCPNGTGGTTGIPYDPNKPCDLLFFGLDRSDNSGDANAGFWFFQQKITLATPSGGGGAGTKFVGLHTPGDILVISGFSNGGTTATISVYVWDPFCASDGKNENPQKPDPPGNNDPACKADNLRLLANLENEEAECFTSDPVGGQGCGIVNPLPASGSATEPSIFMPWTFVDKSGVPNNGALNGEFFEAGINLSLLPLNVGCFQSVLSETRSSTSPTSVLKDFVLGGFGGCQTTLTTTASLNGQTTNIISGNGADSGTASSGTDQATLTIQGTATWAGTLDFHLCGPIATGVCNDTGLKVTTKNVSQASLPADLVSGSVNLSSAGRYCWFAKFTPDAATAAKGVTGATHDGSGGATNLECFTVGPAVQALDTAALESSVTFGSPIRDNAVLSGLAKEPGTNGPDTDFPTIGATNGAFAGTITFNLKGPNDCTSTPAGFTAITGNVNSTAGNGTYGPTQPSGYLIAASFTPTVPGTYHWQAQYLNAGAINNGTSSTHNAACNDTDEDVVVQQIPTQIATAPFAYPQDTASIKVASGNLPLGGTVVFTLFNSLANCQANNGTGVVYGPETKTNVVTSATNEVTGITTTNTTFKVDSSNDTTFFWRVTYTPGGTTHTGRQSACVESTALTLTDAAYPGTLFPPIP